MQKFLQRKIKLTPRNRRYIIIAVVSIVIALGLTWRFTTLPTGISLAERQTLEIAQTASLLDSETVVHLPYYVGLKAVLKLGFDPILTARLLSLTVMMAGLVMFYHLSREWWSRLVAGTGTVMLGTSFWFLLTSRLIDPQSLSLVALCGLLSLFLRLKYESKWWQVCLTGAVAGLSIYMPPLLGWLAIGLTTMAVVHSWRANRGRLDSGWLLYFTSFLAVLVPMLVVVSQNPRLIFDLLGLANLGLQPSALAESILGLIKTLVWDGSAHHSLAIRRVGFIDAATAIFLLLGILRTFSTWQIQRSQLLLLVGGLAILITTLSSQTYLTASYLLPIVYLLVARGLNQYHGEWLKRFPRNSVAKYAALGSMGILILFISVLNLRTFYTAWASSPPVHSQFERLE